VSTPLSISSGVDTVRKIMTEEVPGCVIVFNKETEMLMGAIHKMAGKSVMGVAAHAIGMRSQEAGLLMMLGGEAVKSKNNAEKTDTTDKEVPQEATTGTEGPKE